MLNSRQLNVEERRLPTCSDVKISSRMSADIITPAIASWIKAPVQQVFGQLEYTCSVSSGMMFSRFTGEFINPVKVSAIVLYYLEFACDVF